MTTIAPSQPKVLVLLAAYNGAAWIGEQIESILQQEHVDLRLLIRDDASSDPTVEIVRQFASFDSRVELQRSEIPSGSASQNFFSLIRDNDSAGFDYVALSDQDDIWNQGKIRRATKALRQSPSCSGYSSAVTAVWPDGTSRLLPQEPNPTKADFLFEGAGQGCTFVLTCALYSRLRSFLVGHQELTQGTHFHDWAIYALARTWHLRWFFDPTPSLQYRQHENNDTGARMSLKGITSRFLKIRGGWYRQQLLRISALCHATAPDDVAFSQWYTLLCGPQSLGRRIEIARFCLHGGRRRKSDNTILILSAILGWI